MVKALMTGPLKKITFFAAYLGILLSFLLFFVDLPVFEEEHRITVKELDTLFKQKSSSFFLLDTRPAQVPIQGYILCKILWSRGRGGGGGRWG